MPMATSLNYAADGTGLPRPVHASRRSQRLADTNTNVKPAIMQPANFASVPQAARRISSSATKSASMGRVNSEDMLMKIQVSDLLLATCFCTLALARQADRSLRRRYKN